MATRFVDSYGYQTKLVIADEAFNIYGHPANWNYFFDDTATAASDGERVPLVENVSSFTRRRYKGDEAPINVSAHTRAWVYDPGRKVGNAIPGFAIVLDDGTERRQFTLAGDVSELLLYMQDHVNNTTKLYTQGAVYTVKKVEATGE